MESPSKLGDGVGFVGAGLETRTSLRSLEDTRVAFGPIEGPKGFADVCVFCVRVLGGTASEDRGPGKPGPSYVCMGESMGRRRPMDAVRIVLPAFPSVGGGA